MASSDNAASMILPKDTIITSRRLTLRPAQASDLDAYHALRASPRIMKYSRTHEPDPSPEYTWEKLAPAIPPDSQPYEVREHGTYHFVICLTGGLKKGVSAYTTEWAIQPGAHVGDMGIVAFELAEDGVWEGEVGYMLDERLWGRGLASEALGTFVEHWRELAKGRGWERKVRLKAITEVENVASVRVLEKGGFEERRRWVEQGDNVIDFVLDR